VTVLYYAALYLLAFKVIDDLDAFTYQSKRRTDLLAFMVIGMLMLLLAVAI
jgi:hypothetical protein